MVLTLSTMSTVAIAPTFDLPAWAVFLGSAAGLSMPMPEAVLFVGGIQKEIWLGDIVGNLFKANPHLNYAMNADEFVLAGKVVHIPNAGGKPNVERNRAKLPATVMKRNEVDIYFVLDEFTSDPMLIANADKYELSYDLRNSVIGEQKATLAETVGDWFYYYWASTIAAGMKRTTGSAAAGHYGTGNRKVVTADDIKAIAKMFDNWSIPQDGRVACLDAEMMDQLTSAMGISTYRDFSQYYDAASNKLGRLYGFDFLAPRSTVLRYDNTATPVVYDPDAAVASADNGAGLFWHKDLVIRALGENEMFEDQGSPTYYGDVYSALVRAGGRKKRNDGKGVVALIQAAG